MAAMRSARALERGRQVRGQLRARSSSRSPVGRVAEGQAARRAGTGARGRGGPRVPYSGSPATGWPIAAKWTRIWCVRPVSRRGARRRCRPAAARSPRSGCGPRARPRRAPRGGCAGGGRGRAARRSCRCATPSAPLDQRQVLALDLARLDLRAESRVGVLVAGDDHQAGGVLVEAVDDPAAARPRRRPPARRASRPGSAPCARAPGGRPGPPACRRPGSASSSWTMRGSALTAVGLSLDFVAPPRSRAAGPAARRRRRSRRRRG